MTDLEAANRALVMIGVAPVGGLQDESVPARTMSRLMDGTRRAVLADFPWSFAHRAAPLVRTNDAPPPGYAAVFRYPGDAVNVERVTDGLGRLAEYATLSGPRIAAAVDEGSVEYTALAEDLDDWTPDALECLVTRLAADAAGTLTGSQNLAAGLLQKYQALLRSALHTSAAEEYSPFAAATGYLDVRRTP